VGDGGTIPGGCVAAQPWGNSLVRKIYEKGGEGFNSQKNGAGGHGSASGAPAASEAGAHRLTVRHIEAAVLRKLQSSSGGEVTVEDAYRIFRYFDEDHEGVITVVNLRSALQRLNVDPTAAAFAAFVAKYDPGNTGLIEYGPLSEALVPRDDFGDAHAAVGHGALQRWGTEDDLCDRRAGFDGGGPTGTADDPGQPSCSARVPRQESHVPWVTSVEEVERLLVDKAAARGTTARGVRDMWKFFDLDGSGSIDREEFQTALSHFNISTAPEVVTAFMRKHRADDGGRMNYSEMLANLEPSYAGRGDDSDTVRYIPRLEVCNQAHFHAWGPSSQEVFSGHRGGHATTLDPAETHETSSPSPSSPAAAAAAAAAEEKYDEGRQQMSVKHFRLVLLNWMSARSGNGPAALRKLFTSLDLDSSGLISHAAFGTAITRMNVHPRREDLRRIVRYYDPAGVGYIDFKAFVAEVMPEHDHPGYEPRSWQSIAHRDPEPARANTAPFAHAMSGAQMEKCILEKVRVRLDGHGAARSSVFRELDWDHSGVVYPDVYRKWLERLNFFPDEEAFDRLWRAHDPRGLGCFGYQDFVTRVGAVAKVR
jgi:Ca2+-binding EF-hand superfamily protein